MSGTYATEESATISLRLVRDPLGGLPPKDKLQQRWMVKHPNGEVILEWRDVPVVYNEK